MEYLQILEKLKSEKLYLKKQFKEHPRTFIYIQIIKLISRIRYLEHELKYDFDE